MARIVRGGFVAFDFECSLIPDVDMSRAIVAFGNVSLKLGVFDRVIFYVDGQPLLSYFLRRTLGDGPGCQRSVYLKSEVKVQAASGMSLNHENRVACVAKAALGFRRLLELSLALVGFQWAHWLPHRRPETDYKGSTINGRRLSCRKIPRPRPATSQPVAPS